MKENDLVVISDDSEFIDQQKMDENGDKIPFKIEKYNDDYWDFLGNGGYCYKIEDLELYNNGNPNYEIY